MSREPLREKFLWIFRLLMKIYHFPQLRLKYLCWVESCNGQLEIYLSDRTRKAEISIEFEDTLSLYYLRNVFKM